MARRIATLLVSGCIVAVLVLPSFAGERIVEPRRFAPSSDGELVQAVHPIDGRIWAVWTYRNGSETDIAVSTRSALPDGRWSEPVLIGQGDRIDQGAAAIAFDGHGSVYLAFAERETGLVKLTALAAGAEAWTPARAVSSRGKQSVAPALRFVADRLVLAYVADGQVRIRQFLPISPIIRDPFNMSDGPDPSYGDHPPFPTEEDGGGSEHNTLERPDDAANIDATGIN